MMKTKILIILSLFTCGISSLLAAERADSLSGSKPKVKPELSVDLVSANTWRGSYIAGFSVQPALGFSVEGFSLEAWGSTDLNFSKGGYTEVDWTASYSRWGATISIVDYCWTNADGIFDYFGKYENNHYLELGVGFDFGEWFSKVPISLGANVMLYGANVTDKGEQAYSAYFSIDYNQPIRNILTIDVSVGAALERGNAALYSGNNGFSVVCTSLGASKTFNIKDKININLAVDFIVNPATERFCFAAKAGFSL